jgi:hypothetical protein
MLVVYGIDLHGNKAVRYLKKDIKRRKRESKENSNYAIYQANQKLKEMKGRRIVEAELQRIGEEIRAISGVQQSAYAGHYTVASTPTSGAVASGGVKMGFVDTDMQGTVESVSNIETVDNTYNDVGLDLRGYSLRQLQSRREEYKRIGGDDPTCPACNITFPRKTWQDVFCSPNHRMEFNNQVRRLKRSAS